MECKLWYTQMQPMQISETVQLTTKHLSVLGGLKYGGFILEVRLIEYGFLLPHVWEKKCKDS